MLGWDRWRVPLLNRRQHLAPRQEGRVKRLWPVQVVSPADIPYGDARLDKHFPSCPQVCIHILDSGSPLAANVPRKRRMSNVCPHMKRRPQSLLVKRLAFGRDPALSNEFRETSAVPCKRQNVVHVNSTKLDNLEMR